MSGPTPLTVVTLGCRLNIAESEVLAGFGAPGPVVAVNGCAVTAEAARQTRQAVRRARRDHPAARIAVTGCSAEIEADFYVTMPEVDHVIGNGAKLDAATWGGARRQQPAGAAAGPRSHRSRSPALPRTFEQRVRGFVTVQTGCDHACTFCTIPLGRGPSRSLPFDAVVAQVRRLVEAGYAEVVLTGVDITDYRDGGRPLGTLVRALLRAVPDLPRLRLSSIDSIEADLDLVRAIAEEERLMPHLHLSLQAGDDLVLKRMRRRHRRADAVRFCDTVRRLRPGIALGADLIAGFPTETDAMAERSLSLIEDCGLAMVHVFPYSARLGTPAARMPAVEPGTVRERAARLREAGEAAQRRFLDGAVGASRQVLVEHGGLGRTEHFAPVHLDRAVPPGALLSVRIEASEGRRLGGRVEAELRSSRLA